MGQMIEVDDQVYEWLRSQAIPFEDTPNSVLRRIAGIGHSAVELAIVRDSAGAPRARAERPRKEKRARGGNPFALEFGGLERQAFIVAAEDGTFAVGVNQNEGLVAGATRRGEEMRFDASVCEGDAVKLCGVVVAKFADVARA